jgi:hypothetical protein
MSRLSATTALAPAGPRSLGIVVNRWAEEYQQILHGRAG